MFDYIPGLSQAKSTMLLIRGDRDGALKTQDNFTRSFPVVSQVRAGVEYLSGNETAAKATMNAGGAFVDAIPVVGHVKGAIHYIAGDKEGGDAAMIASSRTTGVMAGAVGGLLLGGSPGAVAGGVAGGAVADSVTTVVDSALHRDTRIHGALTAVKRICDDATIPWRYVHLVAVPASVALAGYKAGRGVAVKTVKNVAQRTKAAYDFVKKRDGFEENAARCERQLYCDITDTAESGGSGEDYEDVGVEASVAEVVLGT